MTHECQNARDGALHVAVVGHLDHGKSTLVGRLRREWRAQLGATVAAAPADDAFVTDQLSEEQAQGLTLETTQVAIDTPGRRLVFIDVPGHQELIRNMLTGASRADVAILVVAADEGLQPQSRRHVLLLALLGITRVMVVINKLDRVGDAEQRFRDLTRQVADLLATAGLTASAVLPVSALTGAGLCAPAPEMPWHAGPSLHAALLALPDPAAPVSGTAVFVVQDVYDTDGARVVAGLLLTGRLEAGQALTCLPGGDPVRVAGVRRFPPDPRPLCAGESAALVLAGPVPPRGSTLAAPGHSLTVNRNIAVRLFWLVDAALAVGEDLLFRVTTQAVPARVTAIRDRIDSDSLEPLPDDGRLQATELATVSLEFAADVVLAPFVQVPALGRFVLERDGVPVAAGTIPAMVLNVAE